MSSHAAILEAPVSEGHYGDALRVHLAEVWENGGSNSAARAAEVEEKLAEEAVLPQLRYSRYLSAGVCWLRSGNKEKAQEAFRKAKSAYPFHHTHTIASVPLDA